MRVKRSFKEFCDGKHNLTGSITKDEAMDVEFNLVRAHAHLIDANDVISKDIYFDVNDINLSLYSKTHKPKGI